MKNREGFAPLIAIGIVAVLVVVAVAGYNVFWKKTIAGQPQAQQNISTPSIFAVMASSSVEVTSPPSISSSSILTASQSASDDKYGLFLPSFGQPVQIDNYADDGVVSSGTYAGYHVLIVAISPGGPGGDIDYIFATKDYQTFILDSNTDPTSLGLSQIFTSRVTGTAPIPIDFPETIFMGNFMLVRGSHFDADFDPIPTSTTMLSSPISGLTIYGFISPAEQANDLYLGAADVFVKDISGVVLEYSFESNEEANGTSTDAHSFYLGSKISAQVPLYQSYGQLDFNGCGEGTDEVLAISPSDLRQIGTTLQGVVLYVPKDSNSELYKDEYNAKITEWSDVLGEMPTMDYVSVAAPSYDAYISKNPILIFQDPWGRWIGIGEEDYEAFTAGCGKPVIYLYPPKQTEVTVKFTSPMLLTTDIPTYAADGWDVMANPDGELNDLQPQFMDCDAIDPAIAGSEYAQSACEHNDYPYLYWEGQASGQYPIPTGGWIVPQANISSFLDQKLTQIGLTDKEKSDMMAYWVPQLLKKDAPYYRMAFFQTAQMDRFIPMDVTPAPETVIRVFLDWSPLAAMPSVQPQPEVLSRVNRQGFTLVEWGGLRQ